MVVVFRTSHPGRTRVRREDETGARSIVQYFRPCRRPIVERYRYVTSQVVPLTSLLSVHVDVRYVVRGGRIGGVFCSGADFYGSGCAVRCSVEPACSKVAASYTGLFVVAPQRHNAEWSHHWLPGKLKYILFI